MVRTLFVQQVGTSDTEDWWMGSGDGEVIVGLETPPRSAIFGESGC
jgi:hypothetical protein